MQSFKKKISKKIEKAEKDFADSRYNEYVTKRYSSIEMRLKFMPEMVFKEMPKNRAGVIALIYPSLKAKILEIKLNSQHYFLNFILLKKTSI